MSLLPRRTSDFHSKVFTCGLIAFEWYGDYPELKGLFGKAIRKADRILNIGCGNSDLSTLMHRDGYKTISNIDFSDGVIQEMKEKTKGLEGLEFINMDMTKMTFEAAKFDSVIDKGALDALYSDDSTKATSLEMFQEINRVLKATGAYVCISLCQEHIITLLLDFWAPLASISLSRIPSKDPKHIPFFLSIKKSTVPEVFFEGEKLSPAQVLRHVLNLQSQAGIRTRLREVGSGVVLELDLFGPGSDAPRYTIVVFDSKKGMKRGTCAAFLVPQGREHEWLFVSGDGIQQLANSAQVSRLFVISMSRLHAYENMEAIQAELSPRILDLAPSDHGKIPFLTTAEGVGSRKVLETFQSDFSGKIWVEEVEEDGATLRRLVFASNPNLVQSEARLEAGQVKPADLAIGYQQTMLAALTLIPSVLTKSALVIGVGGGSLPGTLVTSFPMQVRAVDIDPTVIQIASKHFGLPQSERLSVAVEDGLSAIHALAQGETKVALLIVDVDSKDSSLGMSCPPASFVTKETLTEMKAAIAPDGVLLLNLVARSVNLREAVIRTCRAIFAETHVFVVNEEDLNRVIVAFPSKRAASNPMSQVEVRSQAADIKARYGQAWAWNFLEVENFHLTERQSLVLSSTFCPPKKARQESRKDRGKENKSQKRNDSLVTY